MESRKSRWVGRDFSDDMTRSRFTAYLAGRARPLETPWWDSEFNRRLVYDTMIGHVGLHVSSIDEDNVTFHSKFIGDGIALKAELKVPTMEFRTGELVRMLGPCRHHRNGPVVRFCWFPVKNDRRISPCHVSRLTWSAPAAENGL